VDHSQRLTVCVALGVSVLQSPADSTDDKSGEVNGDAPPQLGVAPHELPQIFAVYELHSNVIALAYLAKLVDLDNVRMDEVGHQLGFADEHLYELVFIGKFLGDGFDGHLAHKPCHFPWRDLYIGSDGYIRPCQSSSQKLGHLLEFDDFKELWNSKDMLKMRRTVNDARSMPGQCSSCYHSSSANWNLRHTFIHLDEEFAPQWDDIEERIEAISP